MAAQPIKSRRQYRKTRRLGLHDVDTLAKQEDLIETEFYNLRDHTDELGNQVYPNGRICYPNQRQEARRIVNFLKEEKSVLATFIADPQYGKTGVSIQVMKMMCQLESRDNPKIPMIYYDQVYVISGVSDLGWKTQTINRLPETVRHRVYHRPTLHKFKQEYDIFGYRALIIFDECHIASREKQTLSRIFQELGIKDVEDFRRRGNKIIQISATPDATLMNAREWGNIAHQIFIPEVPASYSGVRVMLEEGRVKPLIDLSSDNGVDEIFDAFSKFDKGGYHILRLSTSEKNMKIRNEITNRCRDNRFFNDPILYDSDSTPESAISLLDEDPRGMHTIVFVKNRLGASKTVNDKYIGVMYETIQNDTGQIQGLVGRLCGHNRRRGDSAPIVYCNFNSIEKYIKLSDLLFRYDTPGNMWKSPTLRHSKQGISWNHTYVHEPTNLDAEDMRALKLEAEENMEEQKDDNEDVMLRKHREIFLANKRNERETVITKIYAFFQRVEFVSCSKEEIMVAIGQRVNITNYTTWDKQHNKRKILQRNAFGQYDIYMPSYDVVKDLI